MFLYDRQELEAECSKECWWTEVIGSTWSGFGCALNVCLVLHVSPSFLHRFSSSLCHLSNLRRVILLPRYSQIIPFFGISGSSCSLVDVMASAAIWTVSVKGTLFTIILYTNSTSSKYSAMNLGQVTVSYLDTLIVHLSFTDSWLWGGNNASNCAWWVWRCELWYVGHGNRAHETPRGSTFKCLCLYMLSLMGLYELA